MEKDIVYHELKDSMEEGCCPICVLTDKCVRQTMKSVLYESMTDMDIRTAIKDQRGFCHHHSGIFLEEGDALAHAIVYADALRGALQDVVCDEYSHYEQEKNCYFCSLARETEEMYVRACWEAFHQEEFMAKYRQDGLLCMTHLHAMELQSEAHKEPEDFFLTLAQATVDKYQALIRELDEIQRKSDYRFSHEEWTDGERTAWKRAVNVINDRIGLPRAAAHKKRGWFGKGR